MEDDSIIYLLILTHGSYEYKARANKTNINSKEDKQGNVIPLIQPNNVVFPENVSFFQKITYTPFGLYNIMNGNDDITAHEMITHDLMPYLRQKITGIELTDKIKNEVVFESIETKLARSSGDESMVNDLRQLLENRDKICQTYSYDKTQDSNIPLLNKRFDSFDEDEIEEGLESYHGIFIAHQENGGFETGQRSLYKPDKTITTQELVNMLSKKGYKRIILIDFSCDICKSFHGAEPNEEHLNYMNTQIPHMIGRGKKSKIKRQRKCLNKDKTRNKKQKKIYKSCKMKRH